MCDCQIKGVLPDLHKLLSVFYKGKLLHSRICECRTNLIDLKNKQQGRRKVVRLRRASVKDPSVVVAVCGVWYLIHYLCIFSYF